MVFKMFRCLLSTEKQTILLGSHGLQILGITNNENNHDHAESTDLILKNFKRINHLATLSQ
jgi:hypothetical protein